MAGMSSAEFQSLSIGVDEGPSGPVLSVRGEIDTVTAPQLQVSVEQALPSDGVLVVDLSGVTFLSSAGLSVLVRAHQRGDVRIVTNPTILRVFTLTGLAQTLRLFASLDEARV
ncbi:STAS domain-containing protein [Kibdelosporangium philippinense]